MASLCAKFELNRIIEIGLWAKTLSQNLKGGTQHSYRWKILGRANQVNKL